MWKFIVGLCFKMTNRVLTNTNLHLDFELGAHKAVKEMFPDINIIGRFHLAQAMVAKDNLKINYSIVEYCFILF